jgi:hypothetical protein
MLRFFFLMTTQELQHPGRNVLRLRRAYRPQGHGLRLEELFQDRPFTGGRKRMSHAPSLPERWGGTNMSGTGPVYLVCLVCLVCLVHLVYLVCLVHRVGLVQPNKRDKPNRPEQPARSHGHSRRTFMNHAG